MLFSALPVLPPLPVLSVGAPPRETSLEGGEQTWFGNFQPSQLGQHRWKPRWLTFPPASGCLSALSVGATPLETCPQCGRWSLSPLFQPSQSGQHLWKPFITCLPPYLPTPFPPPISANSPPTHSPH